MELPVHSISNAHHFVCRDSATVLHKILHLCVVDVFVKVHSQRASEGAMGGDHTGHAGASPPAPLLYGAARSDAASRCQNGPWRPTLSASGALSFWRYAIINDLLRPLEQQNYGDVYFNI
eukprot:6189958-Pleurochrysis_carterae.AAC.1